MCRDQMWRITAGSKSGFCSYDQAAFKDSLLAFASHLYAVEWNSGLRSQYCPRNSYESLVSECSEIHNQKSMWGVGLGTHSGIDSQLYAVNSEFCCKVLDLYGKMLSKNNSNTLTWRYAHWKQPIFFPLEKQNYHSPPTPLTRAPFCDVVCSTMLTSSWRITVLMQAANNSLQSYQSFFFLFSHPL